MKRLFILLSAVIIALIPMSVSAQEEYSDLLAVVSDEDNLFTEDERISLEENIRTVSETHCIDFAIVTVNDFGEYTTEFDFVDAWKEANCGEDALILMIYNARDVDTRTFTSLGYGYCYTAVGEYFFNCVLDDSNVKDKLSDGKFYDACIEYSALANRFLNQAEKGSPFSDDHIYFPMKYAVIGSVIVFLVTLLGVFIYMQILRSKMKTARFATQARDYLVPGSFALAQSSDIFLYSNVVKTKIETENHSSGGGGGGGSSSGGGGGGTSRF